MLVVTALPFMRRNFFECFYILHLNFWFMGNLFTVGPCRLTLSIHVETAWNQGVETVM